MIVIQENDLYLVRYKERRMPRRFNLASEFSVTVFGMPGGGELITVPADYSTDFTSVPWFVRWRVSKLDGCEAAVVHDWLYNSGQRLYSKAFADRLFYELLLQDSGVSKHTADIMYKSVKMFGGSSWKGR